MREEGIFLAFHSQSEGGSKEHRRREEAYLGDLEGDLVAGHGQGAHNREEQAAVREVVDDDVAGRYDAAIGADGLQAGVCRKAAESTGEWEAQFAAGFVHITISRPKKEVEGRAQAQHVHTPTGQLTVGRMFTTENEGQAPADSSRV